MAEEKYRFKKWWQIIGAYVITVVVFCISDFKTKNDLTLIASPIISIEKKFKSFPGKDTSNYRYITLYGYDKPFEIFLGKYKYDFSLQLQQVDLLKEGDEITLYYREKWFLEGDPINNQVYFIDRKNEAIYIKGNHATIQLYIVLNVFIAISILIIVWVLKYKKD